MKCICDTELNSENMNRFYNGIFICNECVKEYEAFEKILEEEQNGQD